MALGATTAFVLTRSTLETTAMHTVNAPTTIVWVVSVATDLVPVVVLPATVLIRAKQPVFAAR